MIHILRLNDAQMATLSGLLDAGVRATGLRAVRDGSELLTILENAETVAEIEVGKKPKGKK